MNIILLIVVYFVLKRIWERIKLNAEKLEEIDGEFIYTYLEGLLKKEIYFEISEIKAVFFSRIFISNESFKNIVVNIILEDNYNIKLRKKVNCILFLKSCKENSEELYKKILGKFPMGIDISRIIENEIKEYTDRDK